jgi:monothiol glutaredoxin
METLELIKKQIAENQVLLYMKGSPDMPQCGFSARAVNCLKDLGVAFAFVDVLANPDIRRELPKYAEWPTFPQLWVRGELIGGSDIIAEMHASGELKTLLTSV